MDRSEIKRQTQAASRRAPSYLQSDCHQKPQQWPQPDQLGPLTGVGAGRDWEDLRAGGEIMPDDEALARCCTVQFLRQLRHAGLPRRKTTRAQFQRTVKACEHCAARGSRDPGAHNIQAKSHSSARGLQCTLSATSALAPSRLNHSAGFRCGSPVAIAPDANSASAAAPAAASAGWALPAGAEVISARKPPASYSRSCGRRASC